MPRNKDIHKVLVIGSGPIIIGQAAEFDYAGTQACRSLKEEGMEVVLLNSNPATIMTDKDIADKVYIEPLTVEVVEQLILKEKPDSVLPTLGGQAGLNLAMELEEKGFLKEHNVRLIGTTAETIKKAEDRQEFKDTMEKIGEPVAASKVVTTVEDGVAFTKKIGYPVVLRPAYTLGGSGGGIANNEYELREILENGLRLSRVGEVLVERCIAGWKEIEYEVMRDSAGNCITVCNMENIDPVGVHTGDSIVVAPSQTLGDKEYQMLRTSALNIITELGITGGCNVQYALHPESFEYCVIEVNPRVSRSSALASKATGYPIAKVAAKIALGYTLDEIPNAITGKTYASFEPMLDYCVVKIPRLPFDKFITAKRTLTTQMKATGEVMSICHNFEGALMKAIRSLEQHVDSLMSYDFTGLDEDELIEELAVVDDRRIWKIAEAIRRDISKEYIHRITKIDRWFIDKIAILVEMEQALKTQPLTEELLLEAKRMEFPDYVIANLCGRTEADIKALRQGYKITAAYKMVDTCAAEFAAATPYYYSVYGGPDTENEAVAAHDKKKVLVLGSGPIRIAVSDEDVEEYIGIINQIAQEHPILVDKYLMGKEIEVDAVCDGEDILIPGIMEHIERAGIHSGDSISVYPAQTISQRAKDTIAEYTRRLAKALHVVGMINIQFIVCGEEVYVIEVNPRSSRTVPYISKVTGIPIVPLATKVILGYKLKDMGYTPGLQPEAKHIAIKMPVFSFEKIRGADISLGPEMKSTGECLGIAENFNEALYKAFIGAGIKLPKYKNMIITVKDEDQQEVVPIARRFEALGYRIYATRGTARVLKENGIKAIRTNKLEQPAPNLMDLILGHKIDVVIDTPPQGVEHQKDGFVIRRNAIETGVNVLTSLDTAEALVTSLENTDLHNLTLIDIATIASR